MAFNPKISITSAPGITGHLLLVLAEASATNVPVWTSSQFAPPHVSSRQIQITGLNPVIHIATLYETNGVSVTGVIRANFSIDPQFANIEVRPNLFIYGGQTEGFDVGEYRYLDPTDSLEGWDYELEVRATGTLDPDVEYTVDGNNNPIISTPTEFSPTTYSIYENEVWVIKFKPKVSTSNNEQSTTVAFSDTILINEDIELTTDDIGKNFIISSFQPTITITLPDLSSIGANRKMFFSHEAGVAKNAIIKCLGSDLIMWTGGGRNQLILGQMESLELYKAFELYRTPSNLDGVKEVGQLFYSYDNEPLNGLHCDGTEISRTVYSRLWEWINDVLDPSLLISDVTWNASENNKGKFSTGDGSTTFRLPLLKDFIRGAYGSRLVGSFQDWALADHKHQETVGTLPTTLFGKGLSLLKGNYSGTSTQQVDLTSGVYDELTAHVSTGGSKENIVKNVAAYICIKI